MKTGKLQRGPEDHRIWRKVTRAEHVTLQAGKGPPEKDHAEPLKTKYIKQARDRQWGMPKGQLMSREKACVQRILREVLSLDTEWGAQGLIGRRGQGGARKSLVDQLKFVTLGLRRWLSGEVFAMQM